MLFCDTVIAVFIQIILQFGDQQKKTLQFDPIYGYKIGIPNCHIFHMWWDNRQQNAIILKMRQKCYWNNIPNDFNESIKKLCRRFP